MPLGIWIVVHLYEASGREDQSGHLQAGWHNEVSIQYPHIQASEDFLADLPGLIFVHVGGHLGAPAMPPAVQFAYRGVANHHGIKVLGHTVRLSIQRVAQVIKQV